MSNQQSGPWQTAARPRHSQSSSRTPQNRSGTASPSQQNQASQPPRQEGGRSQQQQNNAWTQRSSSTGGSNGQARADLMRQDEAAQSVNGFNATEVKAFLGRDVGAAAYKPAEAAGGGRSSGGAWGSKPNHIANNQPFFVQLAKQIATMEGGG